MARGNLILLETREYRGKYWEGKTKTAYTPKPGQLTQIDPDAGTTTPLVDGNRWQFETMEVDANGGRPKGPVIALINSLDIGQMPTTAFTAGERCRGYTPLPGDEINLWVANLTGTADDHALGEILIFDDTNTKGMFIATASTPETEAAMLLETITDPTADTLSWCIWTGY